MNTYINKHIARLKRQPLVQEGAARVQDGEDTVLGKRWGGLGLKGALQLLISRYG